MGNGTTLDGFEDRLVAHDLRHLLGLVHGYAQVLMEEALPEDSRAHVRRMLLATQRATDLCEDWQRAKEWSAAGQLEFADQHPPLETEVVLREVAELCAQRAQHACVELELQLAEELPTVCVERVVLQRAVLNLVWNALAVVPEGSGRIEIRVSAAPGDGGLLVQVADNGPGLPEQYSGDLTGLAPASRGSWPESDSGALHGFGLILVASFARHCDGCFVGEADERLGGARMVLEVPAVHAES